MQPRGGGGGGAPTDKKPCRVNALVYISTIYDRNGIIRAEYVPRMERAITDGRALGISAVFVDTYVRPLLRRPAPAQPSTPPPPEDCFDRARREYRMSSPGVGGSGLSWTRTSLREAEGKGMQFDKG